MDIPLPSYWMQRPSLPLTDNIRAAFDALLDGAAADGSVTPLEYRLEAPRWQFLCYAAEERGFVLHGSPNPDITRFVPRKASDLNDFGNQEAIYAAADGIWSMYFAIIDRARFPTTLINACIRLESEGGEISPPLYVFSISKEALAKKAWKSGTVYILPRDTFSTEPPIAFGAYRVHTAQLASREPVTPLARLAVSPDDFPFLAQMRGHVDERLQEYANALNTAQPWPPD